MDKTVNADVFPILADGFRRAAESSVAKSSLVRPETGRTLDRVFLVAVKSPWELANTGVEVVADIPFRSWPIEDIEGAKTYVDLLLKKYPS